MHDYSKATEGKVRTWMEHHKTAYMKRTHSVHGAIGYMLVDANPACGTHAPNETLKRLARDVILTGNGK